MADNYIQYYNNYYGDYRKDEVDLHNEYPPQEYTERFPPESGGKKNDQDKPRMDLLDPEFLEDVAQALTFGANKYGDHNWRGGIKYSRIIAAIYRHLTAINRGEDLDPESGLSHTAHLGANVQFLNWMMKHRKDLDNRWK